MYYLVFKCILLKALTQKGAYKEADIWYRKVHETYPENPKFLAQRGNKVFFFLELYIIYSV